MAQVPFRHGTRLRPTLWMRSQGSDPVLAAIASSLPFAPASRWSAIAASARFASADSPASVITLLASGNIFASTLLSDGCTFSSLNDKTTPAAIAGDVTASVWNWNANTRFLSQSSLPARGTVTANGLLLSSSLSISMTSSAFSGWTQGERIYVLRSNALPTGAAPEGLSERFSGSATGDSYIPILQSSQYDVFDSWGTPNAGRTTIMNVPGSTLTNRFLLNSSVATGGAKSSRINLLTPVTATVTIGFDTTYTLFGTGRLNWICFWARQTPLSSGDRTLIQRWMSHYYSLGLY